MLQAASCKLEEALRTLTYAWSRRRTVSFEASYRCVYLICLHGTCADRAVLGEFYVSWLARACAHAHDLARFRVLCTMMGDVFLYFINATTRDEHERRALRSAVPLLLWTRRVVARAALDHWARVAWAPPNGKAFLRLKRGFDEISNEVGEQAAGGRM